MFKDEFKKVLASWYKVDSKLGVTFELAFWIVWVSRWAKENQLKSCTAKSKKEECLFGRGLFEDEKNIYRETFVLRNFTCAVEKYKLYYTLKLIV
jgi:hypothetical protein